MTPTAREYPIALCEEDAVKLFNSPTWEYVFAFALKMEHKLSLNRHKGDREGWVNDRPADLHSRIIDETVELITVIQDHGDCDDVWGEAADVANFAMMVADAYDQQAAPVSRIKCLHTNLPVDQCSCDLHKH